MKNNDQRDMIEQLLGITELSRKADVLKELMKGTRDSIKEEEFRINAITTSNENIEKNIKEIESRSKAWDVNKNLKIEELGNAIIKLETIDIDIELENHKIVDTVAKQKSDHTKNTQKK
jgi:hypothetical protein